MLFCRTKEANAIPDNISVTNTNMAVENITKVGAIKNSPIVKTKELASHNPAKASSGFEFLFIR